MNIPSGTRYNGTTTVTAQSNVSLAAAATALDTNVFNAIDTIYGAPPAGFQDGSINVLPADVGYDGTFYFYSQQIQYSLIAP